MRTDPTQPAILQPNTPPTLDSSEIGLSVEERRWAGEVDRPARDDGDRPLLDLAGGLRVVDAASSPSSPCSMVHKGGHSFVGCSYVG